MKIPRKTIIRIGSRGFSLIEVLIAVLVLALGLLGLGAVIPAVIRQQRQSSDAVLGLAVVRAAEAHLKRHPSFNPGSIDYVAWDIWLARDTWSPVSGPEAYLWEPWWANTSPVEMNPQTGDFTISDASVDPPFYATIRLADRLWPSESAQGADIVRTANDPHRPLFVWDLIGRRVPVRLDNNDNPLEPEKVQVAVFVRRIDPSIRIPRGNVGSGTLARPVTLRDVLTNPDVLVADRRVPVCSHPPGSGPLGYLPTNNGILPNGNRDYSRPVERNNFLGVAATFDPRRRHIIQLDATILGDNRWALVSLPGQKLVDNLGNIYTVRGPVTTAASSREARIEVDPPIPAWVPDQASTGANSPAALRQVVFTPQIPAAVSVFTITRTVE